MPSPTPAKIRSLTDQFAAAIAQLVRQEALAAVEEAFNGKRPKPGRSLRAATDLGPRVLAHVQSHPGSLATEIAAALGVTVKDVTRPMQELVASRSLRKRGKARGTRYYVR